MAGTVPGLLIVAMTVAVSASGHPPAKRADRQHHVAPRRGSSATSSRAAVAPHRGSTFVSSWKAAPGTRFRR